MSDLIPDYVIDTLKKRISFLLEEIPIVNRTMDNISIKNELDNIRKLNGNKIPDSILNLFEIKK